MTNQEFIYWINGHLMLTTETHFDKKQCIIIKNHANLAAAVTGSLEPNVEAFVTYIENEIALKNEIPLDEVKNMAIQLNFKPDAFV